MYKARLFTLMASLVLLAFSLQGVCHAAWHCLLRPSR
jgi:hypothetical protein